MTAIDLASEGLWTNALSIASQGFLSDAVAVLTALSGGGGSAGKRHALMARNDREMARRSAEITQQNHAVLAAIMAFVCLDD